MKASEHILSSPICKQAARNIHPQEPDELFNTCWLTIREKEIQDPTWKPNRDPRHYFLRMMRNKAKDWQKSRKNKSINEIAESQIEIAENTYGIEYEIILIKWIDQPTKNEDLLFLKNIITLAMYCSNITDACKTAEMSRTSFWKYKKQAEKLFYEYYNSTNHYDFPGDTLV